MWYNKIKKEIKTMLTDKQKIAKLERELKAERKKHKVTKKKVAHLKGKMRATEKTFNALQLRKMGNTWKSIGKKLKVPESSIRLATQERYKHAFLRGRWSEEKLDFAELLDSRTMNLIEKQKGAQRGMNYEEYVRTTRS